MTWQKTKGNSQVDNPIILLIHEISASQTLDLASFTYSGNLSYLNF